MIKKCIPLLLLLLLLTGCAPKKQVFQIVYLDAFDTVTTLRGYDISQAEFNRKAERIHNDLLRYHALFDIYHDCPGGIKEINDRAGAAPVQAAAEVIALLRDCRDYCDMTGGQVNAAMGSVLRLWHDAREYGMEHPALAALPDRSALEEAAKHISFDNVILDEANGTVFLTDPVQQLDVGAIAKGWTAQKLSKLLPEGYLLNLGGNVCAIGAKPDGNAWFIGIQDPDNAAQNISTVGLIGQSAVTSGDYQRSYSVDGIPYHHIIDPNTLMPSRYWRSVTILCDDSGLADCLSTALFLMPLEEGRKLVEAQGAEALWIDSNRNIYRTDGFPQS